MGKRRTGRKIAFQTLYQIDMRPEEHEKVIEHFILDGDIFVETRDFALDLVKGAYKEIKHADNIIKSQSIDWDFDRINLVDKSILRLALYEINFTKTPVRVVIDEALELAKQFSTQDSPKFINGILGKYVEKKCSPGSSKKSER